MSHVAAARSAAFAVASPGSLRKAVASRDLVDAFAVTDRV